MLIASTAALAAGFLLDLLLGDPPGWPHLIRGFGHVIAAAERVFYPMKNKRLGGTLLVVCVLLVCGGAPTLLLRLVWRVSPWVFFALEALLCWQLLATKSLRAESLRVYERLAAHDLAGARKAVSMIVGRDTERLDEAGVAKAAVETVAENTSDGVAAPLFWMLLGGAGLGCFYKAANTMDSMIGYKNDRYLEFGRTAAKLDDVLNYLPARLCALAMIAVSPLCGLDGSGAYRIWKRDRRNHASPNSAQTEAAAAGALGVRLAGDAYYFGILHEKPTIGDDLRPIEPADILRAHRLLYAAAIGLCAVSLLIRGGVILAAI